jgi:hypothetical protein
VGKTGVALDVAVDVMVLVAVTLELTRLIRDIKANPRQ